MERIPRKDLERKITEIVKNANLSDLSAKKVRKKLEEEYDRDLSDQKKEIDAIVMEVVMSVTSSDNVTHPVVKRSERCEPDRGDQSGRLPGAQSEPSSSDTDVSLEEDQPPLKKNKKLKNRKTSQSVNDEEIAQRIHALQEEGKPITRHQTKAITKVQKKKPPKEKVEKSPSRKKPTSGYHAVNTLSEPLAEIIGSKQMTRSDVVKRMWEEINKRDLKDPKNKQFILCDEQFKKVFDGRKRVKAFGMMKFLSAHMYKSSEIV